MVDLAKHRHGARTELWLPLEDAPGKKGQAQGEIRIGVTVTDVPYDDNRPAGLNAEVRRRPARLSYLPFVAWGLVT